MKTQNQIIDWGAGENTWIVALAIVCFGIVGYGMFYSTNAISDPAFLAGQYLIYALILWGIFYAIFLRKRGSKLNGIAFAAIYIALFAGGLIAADKQKRQALQALSSIQQEMNRVATFATDSSGLPVRIERAPVQTSGASGDFKEMERLMKEFIDRIVAQRNDYLLELEAIGWNSILDAQRIKRDTTLSESKVMIERAKTIVDKYEKKTTNLMRGTISQINALNMSESMKRDMLAGFEKGMSKSRNKIDEQWRLQRQIVRQFENIVLLLASRSNWLVRGEQILFHKDEDLAKFNTYIGTIQSLVQQQEQIQKSGFADINQKFNDLKNAAK